MTSVVQVVLYTLLWIFHASAAMTIQTTTGKLNGKIEKELNVEAFLGIPYAEPPIGRLRFQRPLPKKPWEGVYIANNLPPSCMQNNSGQYWEPSLDTPMSENCLFLNLWVPNSESKEPKTVMVFIHGGAFTYGSSNMKLYDGANLASKGDVIVGSMNYRLGAFGFLFIEDEEANGNMGMFDQILALKWIKANARAFGGDPDNVVLFGESAGSISIGGFMLSPLTQNLFRRAIMQSGAPEHPYSMNDNALVSFLSKKIVRLAGCSSNKDKAFRTDSVSCMKSLPAKSISDAEGRLKSTPFFVVPRTGDDFIPRDIPRLLSYGNFSSMEVLIGINEDEGAFMLAIAAPDYFKDGEVNIRSRRLALELIRTVLSEVGFKKEAAELSKFYMDLFANGTTDSYLRAFAVAIGDYYVNCGSYFHAEFTSLKNPVFFYVMKNRPASTPFGKWVKMTHLDELQYVFGNPMFERFTPEEEEFSDKIMRRWVAFAKTGNPNIPGEEEWPVFKREDPKYLVLSNKGDSVQSGRPENGRCEMMRKKFGTIITEEVLSRFKQLN